MKLEYTKKFSQLLSETPLAIQKKFAKQIELMFQNVRHPSLQVKKIQGHLNIWEARVDYHFRFTFAWEKDRIILRAIGNHDEVLKNP